MKKASIVLRYVPEASSFGTKFTFKTLRGAQRRAHKLVGPRPKKGPDGYAVGKQGTCLFIVAGASFEELFPQA